MPDGEKVLEIQRKSQRKPDWTEFCVEVPIEKEVVLWYTTKDRNLKSKSRKAWQEVRSMSRSIIISNRLPVTVKRENGKIQYHESIGGLSTGLKSYHKQADSVWVGWPGISEGELTPEEKSGIRETLLRVYQCVPVFLSEKEIDGYYYGFSNGTIWPLFHYFTSITEYDEETWGAYREVNHRFYEAAQPFLEEDALVWIHDYQLMLLPNLVKENYPEAKVGFFLHIPFPSFEIFRLLIWREQILTGLLGADLIGFHTHDYVRHFLNSSRRILGSEDHFNVIEYEGRRIFVEAFPMGIDYQRFDENLGNVDLCQELTQLEEEGGMHLILSVDRLDYTKGIPERIYAFKEFLENNPSYREKVRFLLIVAPSREILDTYDDLLRQIKEAVSETNGELGTLNWMPIWFFFRSFSQEELINYYRHADVLLVTPLRDGMNLVAKEYLAARTDARGMVVLSETAGAASQLVEAVVVNPNHRKGIAEGIKQALEMPESEKIARVTAMRKRIKSYDVNFWADEFVHSLHRRASENAGRTPEIRLEKHYDTVEKAYKKANKRCLFLDYDGTLTGFKSLPEQAKPDPDLLRTLESLGEDFKNTIVLTSGRDRRSLEEWFGFLPNIHLVASHGLWYRNPVTRAWQKTVVVSNRWKKSILPIMELYADYMPGAFIEDKEYSLVLHYRQCDPDMVALKINELRETLHGMIKTSNLELQEGNKVLEIKDNKVNKGQSAAKLLNEGIYEFVLGAGDDATDEHLFSVLPKDAFSIKIGLHKTGARYRLKSWQAMRSLLDCLVKLG